MTRSAGMKSYTQAELRTFVSRVAPELEGSRLQEIRSNDRGLALGFFAEKIIWLVIDLNPVAPMVLRFIDEVPWKKGARSKPAGLFLNACAKGKTLVEMKLLEEWGRVLRLELASAGGLCEVEIQLIPKSPNLIVRADDKKISWSKPRELQPPPQGAIAPPERAFEALHEEWLAELRGDRKPSADPEEQWRRRRDKDVEKKRKALLEIEKLLSSDEAAAWTRRGEEAKAGGPLFEPKRSRSWNIEEAFRKAKQLRAKRQGTEERRRLLQTEIESLLNSRYQPGAAPTPKKNWLQQAEVKGRSLPLGEGSMAFIGRSAADNLALLRKARAWDYWMHLRDYPGAHAILRREKGSSIPQADLDKVARWLAKESMSAKVLQHSQKLAVVLTECRFVRPIKGDKLGRVNYQNERHFFVLLEASH